MQGFLDRQRAELIEFASQCDRLVVEHGDGAADCVFHVHFKFRGLVYGSGGEIRESENFGVRICLPDDYLRRVEMFHVINLLYPLNFFHPNCLAPIHAICLGKLDPGTELLDIVYRAWEIGTWNKVNMSERYALDKNACAWARRNPHRFPVDSRPLKGGNDGFRFRIAESNA
jgi:hypothetical protein